MSEVAAQAVEIEDLDDCGRVVPRLRPGRYVSAVLLIALFGFLAMAAARGNIQWHLVGRYIYAPGVLAGVRNTVLISVLSMLIGLVLGLLGAVMRLSSNVVARSAAAAYVWLFRGTPQLVQLLLWYNLALIFPTIVIPGIGQYDTNHVITPMAAGLLGLGINEGAYMTEIFRGGLLGVDPGQTRAARALGMTPVGTFRRIVLPQALRIAMPGASNQFVILLKGSSLLSIVQYTELLYSVKIVYDRNYAVVELLLVATVWYIAVTGVFVIIQNLIERRLGRSRRRAPRRGART
jgi:polar amino acid transport system permease protein